MVFNPFPGSEFLAWAYTGFFASMMSVVAGKRIEPSVGWCPQQDWVADGRRYYRCSDCNRRLWPKMVYWPDGEFEGWRLPPHKPKGYKIRKKIAKD
jgi:hypothetical protein